MELSREFLKDRKDLRDVDIEKNWRLILTENQIKKRISEMAAELNKKYEGNDIVFLCVLKGGVYFFVDLTREITIPYHIDFVTASSYHNAHTQCETVEIGCLNPTKFQNKKVIICDELFDNGITINAVKEKLMKIANLSEEDVYTVTLFRKERENKVPLADMIGFDHLPDLWLVGYGLDEMQEKRGWVNVYAMPKADGIEKSEYDQIFTSDEYYENFLKQFV